MSRVRKSDVFILESYLRKLDRSMNAKLIMHKGGITNQQYENPVQVQWGSNSFHVDRDELESLVDGLDRRMESDSEIDDKKFLHQFWWPFIREYADR